MPREWDLTSNGAIQAAAEWLLKKSGALLVVIIRVDDLAISADRGCAPRESKLLIEDRMEELYARLTEERAKAQAVIDRRNARQERKAIR